MLLLLVVKVQYDVWHLRDSSSCSVRLVTKPATAPRVKNVFAITASNLVTPARIVHRKLPQKHATTANNQATSRVIAQRHHSNALLVPATTVVTLPIWCVIAHKAVTTMAVVAVVAISVTTVVVTVPATTAVVPTTSVANVTKAHVAITARNTATCPRTAHKASKMEWHRL